MVKTCASPTWKKPINSSAERTELDLRFRLVCGYAYQNQEPLKYQRLFY